MLKFLTDLNELMIAILDEHNFDCEKMQLKVDVQMMCCNEYIRNIRPSVGRKQVVFDAFSGRFVGCHVPLELTVTADNENLNIILPRMGGSDLYACVASA